MEVSSNSSNTAISVTSRLSQGFSSFFFVLVSDDFDAFENIGHFYINTRNESVFVDRC